jgi:hypothetical protein
MSTHSRGRESHGPPEGQLPPPDDQFDDINDEAPAGADDLAEAILDLEQQQRLWLRALLPLLELRSHDSDPSPRVQFAFDVMHIAACERVARICRSDLLTSAE